MPTAQFVNAHRKIHVTKSFPTPKKVGELRAWLKSCQLYIKELPRQIAESEMSAERSIGSDGWFTSNVDVDVKWIKFNLENRIGEKAHLVIDRKGGF